MNAHGNSYGRLQSGFGLIEGLVIVIVVATGLLALASFQGDLMSGSGLSKARGEAMMLAREKLEELTNNIEKTRFITIALVNRNFEDSPVEPAINGVNAQFSRRWRIQDRESGVTGGNGLLKEVTVRVSWTDAKGQAQNVLVNSAIHFSQPDKLGTMEEDDDDEGGLGPKRSGKAYRPGEGPTFAGQGSLISGIPGTFYRYEPMNQNGTSEGIVYVLNANRQAVFAAYGQAVHFVSGIVYYDEPDFYQTNSTRLELIVGATEPSYCDFPIAITDSSQQPVSGSTWEGAQYVCFFGGDCSHGGVDSTGTTCPDTYLGREGLKGGWYGNVGPAGVPALHPDKSICQANTNANEKTGARQYVSKRENDWEGVNQSFSSQNFIVARITGDVAEGCAGLVIAQDVLGLAPSKIERELSGGESNVAVAPDRFWDNAVHIWGKVNWAGGNPAPNDWIITDAQATNNGRCQLWTTGRGYACAVTSGWSGTINLTPNVPYVICQGSPSLTRSGVTSKSTPNPPTVPTISTLCQP